MELKSRRRKYAIPVAFVLMALAVILALVAPEEKILGSYIKIIYIHAAVTWIGLVAYILSGIFAILYFIIPNKNNDPRGERKENMLHRSSGVQLTAILFWAASVTLGSVAAYLTWGGSWWIEPRLRVAIFILVMAVVAYQLRHIVVKNNTKALVNLGLPAAAFFLLATTGKLVHPNNAFAQSDSVQIKFFAGLITLVLALAAANVTPLFIARARESSKCLDTDR